MEIDEPITIVDYDPAWPERFVAERARLLAAFGPENIRIEHFGSTAVPGMAGKPIVDLLVGVSREAQLDSAIDRLVPLGYENFGEIFLSGRHYLRRRGPPHFNVALTVENSQFWGIQMMVREFLRAHPAEVTAYSASKRAAYAGGATLFSTYSQVKAPFLAELLERARAWCRGRATSLTEGSFD